MNKETSFKLVALVFGLLLALVAFSIIAWQEPGKIPPEGNVPAPINVGPQPQTKAGPLGVTSILFVPQEEPALPQKGQVYYDSDVNLLCVFDGAQWKKFPKLEPAEIKVIPSSRDFEKVNIGSSKDLTFEVQNVGEETLIGSATVDSPFSVVKGANYNIPGGDSHNVTVRFSPTEKQNYAKTVHFSGGGGELATVSGKGCEYTCMSVGVCVKEEPCACCGTWGCCSDCCGCCLEWETTYECAQSCP